MNKKDKTTGYIKQGIFWNSINNVARYGLIFVGTIVLARILTPEDYGLIGILTVFITIAEVLIDAGLGGAIIKKKDVTEIDYSTLTVYNLCASIIIYLVFYFSAPFIGDFYDRPILEKLLRLYSIVILIFSLTIVPRVQLMKRLRFKALSLISLIAGGSGLFVAIMLARLGFGVFSLVWQYIVNALVTSILLWSISKYKIRFNFSYLSFKEQFAFGVNTTFANSLKSINDNIYANIIGKVSNITQTGYYTQSARLSAVPTSFLSNLIDSTFFPIFSQEADEKTFSEKLNSINKKMACSIIVLFGAAIPICKELIYILLGSQWLKAELTLEVLLIGNMFISIANIGRNLLKCLGETFLILKTEVYIFILSLIIISIMSFYGYYHIIFCFLVMSIIKAIYINLIAYKHINVSLLSLFKPVIYVILWTSIAVFVAFSVNFLGMNYYISLFIKLLVFVLVLGIWFIRNDNIINVLRKK